MTSSSAWDEAIAAATSSNVADAIKAGVVDPVKQAIVERVDLATLHEVDEALSMPAARPVGPRMPWVGGSPLSRAIQPIADETEQAIHEALGATAKVVEDRGATEDTD